VSPIVIVFALGAAFCLGLLANRWVRPFAKSEVQGVKLELLVAPLMTLTVVLLAFLLVQVYGSFVKTRDAAGEEAGKVAFEYDIAGYFPARYATPLQTSLVCYARSIVAVEWPTLAEERTLTPEPAYWTRRIDNVFARLAVERNSQPYGTILGVDKERAEARRKRLTEAQPTIPDGLMLLMLAIGCAAIFTVATFTLPYVSRRVQIGALSMLVIALSGLLLTLRDLDGKYDGWSKVESTDMQTVDQVLTANFSRDHPTVKLPCDAAGRPPGRPAA
jgi:hypothetical protein